ncbi:hypothetical protein G9A89_007239 [Geosiphon pyriformis]|nr:hypothetical protein G9A89_007239 [Geosiphon pyriformis]
MVGQKTYQKWSSEDKKILLKAFMEHGNNWELLKKNYFPSLTPKALKEFWREFKHTRTNKDCEFDFDTVKWTPSEDKKLKNAVKLFGNDPIEWKKISDNHFPNRSYRELFKHYENVIAHSKRGLWTEREDNQLKDLIKKYGKNWKEISHKLGRPPHLIYERYNQHLAPGTKKGNFTDEELQKLAKSLHEYGED